MCQMLLDLYSASGHGNIKVNGVELQGCGMLSTKCFAQLFSSSEENFNEYFHGVYIPVIACGIV